MADNNERRKMKELLREKEKGDVPLQWMYKESKPDAEDFLLGKRIDKIGESEDIKQDQFALILEERTKHIIEMDTKAKMREDPLFAIRKQEEDAKRKLLENPVKMKRLQKALERQNKSEHKKSKKKKHKKGKSDSDGSDDDLMSAYLNILKSKQKGGDMEGKYVQKTKEKGVNNAREVSPVARERTGQRVNTQQVGREEKRQMDSYSEQRPEGKQKRRHSSSESDNDAESDNRRMNRLKDVAQRSEKGERSRSGRDARRSRSPDRYRSHRDGNTDWSGRNQREPYSDGRDRHKDLSDRNEKRRHDSDSDEDNNAKSKHTRNNGKQAGNSVRKSSSSSDSESDKVFDKNKKIKMETSSRNVKPTRNRSSSLSEDDVKRSRLKQGKHSGRSQQHSLKTHASSSESSSDSESNVKARQASKYASSDDSDREKPMKKKSFGLVILNPENEHIKARSKVKVTRDYRSTSRSPDRRLKPAGRTDEKRSPPQQPKRKLTEEERQRRLAEMEENARWREDQRRGNVTRYQEEDREEEAKQSRNYETTGSSEFVNPLMSKHAENSSVEDRIKRNRHNILRTTADMDRGFSKR